MSGIFHPDTGGSKIGNIILPAYASHESGEPGPDGIAVELSQQRGMMEADPAASAFSNVMLKCGGGPGRPAIGGKVQLNKEGVLRKGTIVDGIGIIDIVDDEITVGGQLVQPHLCRAGVFDMVTAILIKDEH